MTEDYWIGFNGDSIISAQCPSGQCCQIPSGCDYIADAASLCAPGRDPDSFLCGQCLSGYSISLNSNQCTKCNTFRWWYLLLPLSMASIVVMVVLYTKLNRKPHSHNVVELQKGSSRNVLDLPPNFESTETTKKMDDKQRLHSKRMGVLWSLILIVVYYEQSLSQMKTTRMSISK